MEFVFFFIHLFTNLTFAERSEFRFACILPSCNYSSRDKNFSFSHHVNRRYFVCEIQWNRDCDSWVGKGSRGSRNWFTNCRINRLNEMRWDVRNKQTTNASRRDHYDDGWELIFEMITSGITLFIYLFFMKWNEMKFNRWRRVVCSGCICAK